MSTVSEVPLTLTPIRRGAVIDWKATAIAEHSRAQHNAALVKENARLRTEVDNLNRCVADAYELCSKHFGTLAAIRAHWSAFFLPRLLR